MKKKPGPKPKHGEPTVMVPARIPHSVVDKLDASRGSLSRTEFIIRALRKALGMGGQ